MNKLKQEGISIIIFLLIICAGIIMNINKYGITNQVFFVSMLALLGWAPWFMSFMTRFVKQSGSEK